MLLPSRLVQRFFPIVLILMLAIFSAVYFYSVPFIKEKVYEIERNSSRIALDNIFTLADRMYADTESFRQQAMESHKQRLKVVVSMAESYLDQVSRQVRDGELTNQQARRVVLEMIRHFKSQDGDYIWVASYDSRFLAHPDERFDGMDASDLENIEGIVVLPQIVQLAVSKGEGFYQYKWNRLEGDQQLDKLSYVKNYPQWGFVLGSGIYLDDVDQELEDKRNRAVEELRESFKALRVAKTGYLFIFDAKTNMLIHPNPNIDGTNIEDLLNPVTGKSIADDLIAVADTGKELYYKWDKPDDQGNYIHEKLSLVRYLKGFDWYICSSVYVDELKASSELLSERILTIALISMLVAIAMAFFFIYWVTNPIKQMADTALRVSRGELTASVGFRRDDELGILAKTFDDMVDRLRDNIQNLDEKVNNRTVELELTNQKLIETIKSRIEAQDALALIEERQRIILDLLPAQVAYVDHELIFRFVNSHYASYVGRDKQEIIGHALEQVSRHHYQTMLEQITQALSGQESTGEYSQWNDGQELITKRFLTPCRDNTGRVVGVLLVALDVTTEKHAEKKLLEAQRMSAVGHLAGGLAHDFNNLLSIIIGNLMAAADKYQGDQVLQGYLNPSVRAARRSADITSRLLAFSRRQPLAPLRCDIQTLIQETIELLRSSLPSHIELIYEPIEINHLPFVDPGRLEDALVNLVLNAKEAMPKGGKIRFYVEELSVTDELILMDETVVPGNYIRISVADEGTGFTAEAKRLAFEPFFTTRPGGAGTGLGLSMVYGFVKQSDGYIHVASEPGAGATVSLLLPSVYVASLSDERGVSSEISTDLKGKLALLVEDDDDVRQVVREMLISTGFNVIEASEAKEAIELIELLEDIYCLVSDVRLRGALNGFDIADCFRSYHQELPVVLMTGYAFDETLQRRVGNEYYVLRKPFDINELKEVFSVKYNNNSGASTDEPT